MNSTAQYRKVKPVVGAAPVIASAPPQVQPQEYKKVSLPNLQAGVNVKGAKASQVQLQEVGYRRNEPVLQSMDAKKGK